jgi:hypothetical protein
MSKRLNELQHKANHLKHLLVMSQVYEKGFLYYNKKEIILNKVVDINFLSSDKLTLKDLVIEQQNLIDDLLAFANNPQ